MLIRPYLIATQLIPQPTWGGAYIASLKKLDQAIFGDLKIGQSFELATTSKLSTEHDSINVPVELCDPGTGSVQETIGDVHTLFTLQTLIDQDPEAVLGKRVVQTDGSSMKVLIKFTQAKGNSFQVHIKPGTTLGHWKPKPESWYFMENGKATLGLKEGMTTEAYKACCLAIEATATSLSTQVKDGSLPIADAKAKLSEFITANSPFVFVNECDVVKGTVVDLSDGGIHHSWEEGASIPNGNIVYEVQVNVMDNDCTLRSFDKGKMAEDGVIRPVHVEDYFKALDTTPEANEPASLMRMPIAHSEEGINVTKLFATPHYTSVILDLAREYTGTWTTTSPENSFHHLFVATGDITLMSHSGDVYLRQGSSVFIPANTGAYTLSTDGTAQVILTTG